MFKNLTQTLFEPEYCKNLNSYLCQKTLKDNERSQTMLLKAKNETKIRTQLLNVKKQNMAKLDARVEEQYKQLSGLCVFAKK